MPTENSKVALEFDGDDVINGLVKIIENSERVGKVLDSLAASGSVMADAFVHYSKKMQDALGAPLTEAQKLSKGTQSILRDLQNQIKTVGTAVDSVDMKPWQVQAKKYNDELVAGRKSLSDLEEQSKKITVDKKEQVKIQKELEEGQKRLTQLAEKHKQHISQLKDLDQAQALQQRAAAMDQAGQQVRSTMSDVRNVSAGVFTALSFGIVSGTKKLGELDNELAQFRAVANATEGDVKALVEQAKGLEGIKTTAAAKAAVELGRAGVEARQATEALGFLSDAAIVAGEDMDRVSKIALSTNKAFGRQIGDLSDTTDILAATANATDTSISEIGIAMGYVGSSARQANQTLTHTASVLGILQDAGIPASMAANALENALVLLQAPAKEGREVLDKLKLEIKDGNKEMRPFLDIVADLKVKMSNLSNIKKTELMKKVFGDVGGRAVVTMLNQSEEQIKKITDAVDNHAGEVERSAEIIKKSLGFEIKELEKDFENLRMEIAEATLPGVRELMSLLKGGAESFNSLSEETKKAIGQALLFATGVAGLLTVLGTLGLGVWGLITGYKSLREALVVTKTAVELSGGGFKGLATTIGASTIALSGLAFAAYKVVEAVNDMAKAVQQADEDWTTYYKTVDRTSGALAKANQIDSNKLTHTQARDAGSNAANLLKQNQQKLSELKELWIDYKEIEKQWQNPSMGADPHVLSAQLDTAKNNLKKFGVTTEAEFIRVSGAIGREVAKFEKEVDKYTKISTKLRAQDDKPKTDGKPPKTTANRGGLTDSDFADSDQKEEARALIESITTANERLLNTEKERISNMKTLQSTAEGAGSAVSRALMEASKRTAELTNTSGECYKFFGKALVQAEKSAGIVSSTEKVLKAGKSLAFDVRGDERDFAYQFNNAAQRGVKRGLLEEYHPKSLKDVTEGTMMVLPAGWYAGNKAGHVGVLDKDAYDYSDHKDNVLHRNPQLLKNPNAHFYRYKGSASTAPTKDELKAQAEYNSLNKTFNDLTTEKNKLIAKYGAESDAVKVVTAKIAEIEAKLPAARAKSNEEALKAAEEYSKRIQAIDDSIFRMHLENEEERISQMTDTIAKIEMMRDSTRDKINQEEATALRDFKGTEKQKADIQTEYEEKRKLSDARFNRQLIIESEARADAVIELDNKIRQNEIEGMADGVNKRLAIVDKALREELHRLDRQQKDVTKGYKEGSAEWTRFETLKTQATQEAEEQRALIRIDAQKKAIEASKALLDSELSDSEKSFVSSVQSTVKTGISSGQLGENGQGSARFFAKPEVLEGLASSLGGGSIDNAAEALQKISAYNQQIISEEYLQLALLEQKSTTSDEYKAQQVRINNLVRENTQMQIILKSLEDEKLRGSIAGWQDVLKNQAEANRQAEQFNSVVNSIGGTLSSLASMFGDVGRDIATGINAATSAALSFGTFQNSIGKIAGGVDGKSIAGLLSDPSGMTAAVDLLTKGAELTLETFRQVFTLGSRTQEALKAKADARFEYERDKEIKLAQEKVRLRKEAGEDTFQAELSLINQETQAKLSALHKQSEEARKKSGTGWFGMMTPEDVAAYEQTMMGLYAQRDDVLAEAQRKADQAQKESIDRRVALEQESADRVLETRILSAMNTNDRLAEIEAQADKQRLENKQKLAETLAKGGLDTDALNTLMAFFAAEDERLNQETAQKKRDAQADENRAALDEEYRHREHVINLKDDGFQKELELMKFSRDKELAMLDNEMARHEEGSDEYKRLASERADAEEAAQQRISQALAENQKRRREYNQDLDASIAELKAKLTESTSDDVLASAQGALNQLNRDEEAERKQSIADHGNNQVLLNKITEKYQLLRADRYRQIEKGTLDAIKADYEKAEKEKLDAQLKPIELAIKAEERKIAALQKQNAEYEKQLALIDERYEKLNQDFDARDKTEFEGKLSEIDLQKALAEGIDHIANTDIQGEKLDRSSVATQRRGLNELLAQQEKDAKSALSLEEINQAQFSAEMERITLLRAASTQAAMEDAKTDRERSDLKAELAEQYIAYQELIKERFEEQRKAEGRQYDQEIRNNNTEIRKSQEVVESKKADLEVLQTAYDERMLAISNAVSGVNMSHQEWLSKLMGVEPAMANAARAAVQSLGKIKQEYGAFLASMGMPSSVTVRGEEIQLHSGGYQTGFYNQDGTPIANAPSRTKAGSDADGVFSILGPDGKYYRTTDEMMRANDPSGFEDGGDIPGLSQYFNDRAIVRVSGAEKILNRVNSANINDMLSFWKAHQSSIVNNSTGGNNSFYFDISSDVDIVKIENVFNRFMDKRDRVQLKRMGPNAQKRG